MKTKGALVATLLGALLAVTGCATKKPTAQYNGPRFTEAERAGAVFKHDSWNYIFQLQPAVMDGPFRKILTIDDVGREVRETAPSRELAVVLVGWQFSPMECAALGQRWTEVLRGAGFDRVVCVKTASETRINGGPLMFDSGTQGRAVTASLGGALAAPAP